MERALASSFKSRIPFIARSPLVAIFLSMVTVGGVSSAVKLISVVKGSLIARQFGVSTDLDAFYIAFLLPSFVSDLFAGATVVALVPLYVRAREREGPEAAQKLFGSIATGATVGLACIAVILWALSPTLIPFFGTSFQPQQLMLTRSLCSYLIPLIPLTGLSAIFTAVLTARNRLAFATLAPAVSTLFVIFSIYGFAHRWGIYAFAIGTTLGLAAQVVVLAVVLKRLDLLPRFQWSGFTPAITSFLRQLVIVAVGSSIFNLTDMVDLYYAAATGPGNVSALNYGNKVVVMIVGLAGVAVTTAVLPHMSKAFSTRDFAGAKQIIHTYSSVILLVTIPVTILLIRLSPAIVTILFERNAFTRSDTLLVSAIQRAFLLQIPLHVLGMLFVSIVWALRANWVFLVINPICLLGKIVLNSILITTYGVAGIGLATSIIYGLSCLLLLLAITILMKRDADLCPTNAR